MKKLGGYIKALFRGVGRYIADFGKSFSEGDIYVKLSAVIMGAGYFGRKQYIKGLLITLFQFAFRSEERRVGKEC